MQQGRLENTFAEPSRESAELFQLIIENIKDYAIFMIDREGRVKSWNPGIEHLLGYTENEIIGQPISIIFTPEDVAAGAHLKEMETAAQTGHAEDKRWHQRKDNSRFWANGMVMPLKNEDGTLRGFAKVMRDDTGQKLAEDNLEQVLSSITDSFYRFDPNFRYTYVNQATTEMFGFTKEEFLGKTLSELFPDVAGNRFHAEISRALREQKTISFENYYEPLDRWFENRVYPSADGLSIFTAEITERKRSETDLRKSEEKYRTLFDSIDAGFCVQQIIFDDYDKAVDFSFLEANPAYEQQTGLRNVVGKSVRELIPDLEPEWFEIYGRVALTGEAIRFENYVAAINRWFELYAFRTGKPEDRQVAVLFNDVTMRKRAQSEREQLLAQLDAERARLSYLFNQAPAFVATLRGPEHVFELTNPAYLQLIGHRDVIGKPVREALPEIEGQGYFELFDRVYQTGEPVAGREVSIDLQREPAGALEKRFIDFVYQPIFAADKSVSGIFVHGVDITAQVEARQAAENANRLKDEFLATLSHELRTPLNAILGWSQMLKANNLDASEATKAVETIERNARAQNQLIEDLLDVSRIITGKLRLDVRAVELSSVIQAAMDTVRPAAEAKNIRLQMLLDPTAGLISGDADRLQQVVWNLLSNAVKFTPKNGRVQVRLERVNSHVEIVVSDTGKGIDPAFLPFVFDRFRQADQTSTRSFGGLGLGLAIVRQIVDLHGGTITVKSEGADRGTTFTVGLPLLPVRTEPASEVPRVHPKARSGAGPGCPPELLGLRVLLVDDEADSRDLLNVVLEGCGAQVATESSAAEALKAIKHEKFDVVVSDIGMPGEDGFSLINKIRNLPDEAGGAVPAIALTAYARAEDRVRALRAGFQMHIAKPVEATELIVAIANLAGRMRNSNHFGNS